MKRISTRLAGVLALAGLFGTGLAAAAAAFPTQPIRIVVPYGTGGSPDVMARMISQHVSEQLGQAVVVENRPGANGIVAAQAVAREKPDGHTLLVADTGHLAINPGLYSKLPYDPVADFAPVKAVVITPLFLLVRQDLPVASLAELIDYAKANPGKLSYASSGNGSPHHLGMERLKAMTGIDMVHVPFKGVAESVPSLVAGRTDPMLVSLSSVAPHIRAGTVRVIAVGTQRESPLMPGVPAISEAGVPGFEAYSRIGFVAPAQTPEDRLIILEQAIANALASPQVREKLAPFGMEALDMSRQAYGDQIQAKIPQYRELTEALQLKVD